MNHTKRAAILVHYDRDNIVDEYIFTYLKALKACVSHLVFVSTSKLNNTQQNHLYQYCDTVIARENIGYDFMSYKIGLESFCYQDFDEVLISNDSVYGPFYPMQRLFDSMNTKKCDFWGITDNTDMEYHIQSYFLLFKKSVLLSKVFQDFWRNLEILHDKDEIIQRYEVGLTQSLLKTGFTPEVSTHFKPTNIQKLGIVLRKFTPRKIISKINSILSGKAKIVRIGKINTTHYFWKELLLSGEVPFIKIELLRDNPMNIDTHDFKKIISNVSKNYDIRQIEEHLARMKRV